MRITPLILGVAAVVALTGCGGAGNDGAGSTSVGAAVPTDVSTEAVSTSVPAADSATMAPVTTDSTAATQPTTRDVSSPAVPATTQPPKGGPTVQTVPVTVQGPDGPPISADEVAALERDLDELDQLLADIELDMEQD
jgi:hypothetical protein